MTAKTAILCVSFLALSLGIPTICEAQMTDDIAKVIGRGDVDRTRLPDPPVPLYQGNGRFGCCYGPFGLHVNPSAPKEWNWFGRTRFTHMQHFFRGKFNADYLLGLARMYWAKTPAKLDAYHQHQSFYDGTVVTSFAGDGQNVTVTTWFDPVNDDVAGYLIDVQDGSPEIIFEPIKTQGVHYGQRVTQDCTATLVDGGADVTIAAKGIKTDMTIRTDAAVKVDGANLRLTLHKGVNMVLVTVGGRPDVSAEKSLARTKSWWHKKWGSAGWIDVPDDSAQQVWVRSAAYILYSANDDKLGMMPPCGLTGNAWPFSFPQDLSYIHPALLAMGQIDIAKSWIEYWAHELPAMERYTRRLLKTDGVLMPWVFSYGGVDGMHDPEPPNINYYELHNTGYLCRMAHETARGRQRSPMDRAIRDAADPRVGGVLQGHQPQGRRRPVAHRHQALRRPGRVRRQEPEGLPLRVVQRPVLPGDGRRVRAR